MRDKDRVITWTILLLTIVLCFVSLSLKPPHSDESGNGFFVNQIWEKGFYSYDPGNYHGPLLFYLFQISEKIFGFGIASFRIVTAAFSVLLVWLILRNRDLLGRYASFFSASALALSPGISFFGRSAIHESVFVFFQILLVTGFLRARGQMDRQGVARVLVGLLGCMLLKETFVIVLLSLLFAWGWAEWSPRVTGSSRKMESMPGWALNDQDKPFFLKTVLVCAVVWLALFTGFFHHWQGAADFFSALMPWLKTGVGGSGHDKPFSYWLKLFERYEWVAAAGFTGAFIGLFGRSWKMRFFSAMGLISWLVYSVISYKTPWCVITILWPFVVVAGLWFEIVVLGFRQTSVYWVSACLVAFMAGHSAMAAVKLNFLSYTDPSEPYVYVQTTNDLKAVEDIIGKKIQSSPGFRNMRVQINLKDPWPFPWLFSRFPNIAFGDAKAAFSAGADVIFAEVSHEDRDTEHLYWRRKVDLRDAREPIYVYLRKNFFAGIDLPGFGSSDLPEGKGI